MVDVTRREFLAGSALAATAAVVGWRPLPRGEVVQTGAPPTPVGGIVTLAAYIQMTRALLAQAPEMADTLARERLERHMEHLPEGVVEPFGEPVIDWSDEADWSRDFRTYRMRWDWYATPELIEQQRALALAEAVA